MSAKASLSGEFGDMRLEAARRRLREVTGQSQSDLLEALREIVTTLLGCEEMGLFSTQDEQGELIWSFGIDAQDYGNLNSFDKFGLHEARRGEIYLDKSNNADENTESSLRVFVPIYAGGRVAAILILLKLLPQKVDFDQTDVKVAMTLSHEVGRKLFPETTYGGIRLSGEVNGS